MKRMAMCTFLKIPLIFALIEDNWFLISSFALNPLNNTYQVAFGTLHCAFVWEWEWKGQTVSWSLGYTLRSTDLGHEDERVGNTNGWETPNWTKPKFLLRAFIYMQLYFW